MNPPGYAMALRIGLFYAAMYVGTGVSMTWISVWFLHRGLTGPEIGVILAAPMLGRVAASPLLAVWADGFRYRRTGLAIMAAGALAAFVLLGLTSGFWAAFVFWFISGVLVASLSPLTDVIALRRGRLDGFPYALPRGVGSAAYIIGNVGGGAVISRLSPDWVLYWTILSAVATLMVALWLLPPEPTHPEGEPSASAVRWRGLGALLRDPVFMLAILSAGLINAAHAYYYAFSTVLWLKQGLSPLMTGVLWAVGVVAEILYFWLAEPWRRRMGPERLVIYGGLGALIRWTALAFAPPLWLLFPLQALHAASFSTTFLGSLQLVERLSPPSNASAAQTLNASFSSGLLIGLATLVSGWLYASVGSAGYFVMAAMSALGLAGAVKLRQVLASRG
jgi:PPP family 3-phenylpropionic acid transporter